MALIFLGICAKKLCVAFFIAFPFFYLIWRNYSVEIQWLIKILGKKNQISCAEVLFRSQAWET